MTFNDAVLLIYPILFLVVAIISFFFWSNSGVVILARLTGKPIIIIEGISSAIEGDVWKSYVIEGPVTGRKTAWRYPMTKTGVVKLNEDGTGEYCGSVVWKKI